MSLKYTLLGDYRRNRGFYGGGGTMKKQNNAHIKDNEYLQLTLKYTLGDYRRNRGFYGVILPVELEDNCEKFSAYSGYIFNVTTCSRKSQKEFDRAKEGIRRCRESITFMAKEIFKTQGWPIEQLEKAVDDCLEGF